MGVVANSNWTRGGGGRPLRSLPEQIEPFLSDSAIGPALQTLSNVLPQLNRRIARAKLLGEQAPFKYELIILPYYGSDHDSLFKVSLAAARDSLANYDGLIGLDTYSSVQLPPGVGPIGVHNFPLARAMSAVATRLKQAETIESDGSLNPNWELHVQLRELLSALTIYQTDFKLAKMLLGMRQRGIQRAILITEAHDGFQYYGGSLKFSLTSKYIATIPECDQLHDFPSGSARVHGGSIMTGLIILH